jgi:hypothetical protein
MSSAVILMLGKQQHGNTGNRVIDMGCCKQAITPTENYW